jgi:prepilin-type N-terminal cleavage/methylation domain-containing protein
VTCSEAERRHGTRRGFSLLELLAVVTIMGILAVVVVPRIGLHTNKAKRECCQQYKADINAAIERYWMDNSTFPTTVDDLHPDYYPAELPVCPVTGAAYTIDQTIGRVSGHNH